MILFFVVVLLCCSGTCTGRNSPNLDVCTTTSVFNVPNSAGV